MGVKVWASGSGGGVGSGWMPSDMWLLVVSWMSSEVADLGLTSVWCVGSVVWGLESWSVVRELVSWSVVRGLVSWSVGLSWGVDGSRWIRSRMADGPCVGHGEGSVQRRIAE